MPSAIVRVTEVVDLDGVRQVRAARAGDAHAFELLAGTVLPSAYRLSAAILGSQVDAADATQNALIAAWRELPNLRNDGAFEPWFRRILVNECRMQLRRRSRSRELPNAEEAAAVVPDIASAAALARIEALDSLEGAFEQLEADDRVVVALHYLLDRPIAEIADVLHMPNGTVKWRLHRAREVLHRALENQS
ncbi:MAG TPA: RNA polymerase sigma factor [Candidatus Limnocylindrales bacterium]|nr:RNA polymerase sigma factor [Candidatus Limnocylindrales bacterium]